MDTFAALVAPPFGPLLEDARLHALGVLALALIAAVFLMLRARRARRRLAVLEASEISLRRAKREAPAICRVRVKAIREPERLLRAPASGREVVAFAVQVLDAKVGQREGGRLRRAHTDRVTCRVSDAKGVAELSLARAELRLSEASVKSGFVEDDESSRALAAGLPAARPGRVLRYRELALVPGHEVSVIGRVTEKDGALRIGSTDGWLLVTDEPIEPLRAQSARQVSRARVGAVVIVLAGLALAAARLFSAGLVP